ncbi:hypothetical protein WICPIJ_005046 [Wickerhamomyces pijperi]|uniref:Protein CASP n=1 Tax=Wickerhamomyces pijperi TaxID=599730 RepID=A0A9P8TM64_WICPI|nr:hypothetical protein WICPIJ_005046 [Wickerhamomyces pijperi]
MPDNESAAINAEDQLNAAGKSTSSFEKALHSWTEVSLPILQQQLDDKGILLNETQTKSLESRKGLATKTKEFRKLDDDLKLKEFKSLLKLYQQEVDSLTERAKQAESSFFDVYRSIGELPDPKPLLEASLDSVIVSQEIDELRSKNNSLQEELLKFADYDQLKAKLLRLEQKSSETLNNRLKMKEDELNAVFQEKESNWLEKEENFNQKTRDYERRIQELLTQQKIDQIKLKNQRMALGVDEADEEEENAALSQQAAEAEGEYDPKISAKLEQVQKDFEYQRSLNNKLEKRNETLIKELSLAKSDNLQNETKLAKELKLNELESENATLVATLDHIKLSSESKAKKSQLVISNLQRDVKSLTGEISSLQNKLVKYKDYEDIKQELNTLRQISFGTGEDEDASDDEDTKVQETLSGQTDSGSAGAGSGSGNEKLDEILINRNKKLTQEIIDFRLKCEELTTQVTTLQQECHKSKEDVAKLSELNNKLETDLSHFQSAATSHPRFDSMSMVSGVGKFNNNNSNSNRAASIISVDEGEQSSGNNLSSVLPIVTAQRDRFRSRNLELETQLKTQQQKMKDLEGKIKKLNKDNAELFERTRYLSSFNKGSVNRHGAGAGIMDADLERNSQYEQNYEDSLNPLTKFREREQERISSKLSPLERIFLGFARAILANKTSRLLFLGYCVGLHCLVMLMSFYVMGLHGSLTPDVGLVEKTASMGGNLGTRP